MPTVPELRRKPRQFGLASLVAAVVAAAMLFGVLWTNGGLALCVASVAVWVASGRVVGEDTGFGPLIGGILGGIIASVAMCSRLHPATHEAVVQMAILAANAGLVFGVIGDALHQLIRRR